MCKMSIYGSLILLILSFACVNNNQKKGIVINEQPVYAINLENCLNTQKQIKLSEIADTIEYIELKMPSSQVIVAWDIKCSKEFIFAQFGFSVCQFSKDGNFIQQIGKKGQGPGEYNLFKGYSIDEKKQEVTIIDAQKVLFYSFDGSFLRSLKLNGYTNLVQADTFYYGAGQVYGREKYMLTMLNNSLDTIGGIPNTRFYEPGEGFTITTYARGRDPFYTYEDKVYFKGFEDNDTIWELDGFNYKTHAFIDMGKFKSPQNATISERLENIRKKLGDFYFIPRVLEDNRYIYLQCNYYYNPEMKMPRIIFEKDKLGGFVAKDNSGEYGIINDIAGGPTFWPVLITDDYYMSVIEPIDLLNQSENLINPSPDFNEFLKTVDEDKSNSIIIRAKRKKSN